MKTKRTRHVCVLLPSKQHLDCTVGMRATGHEVLTSVLQQLDVSDLQVFGLAVLRENEYLFLDLDQKLGKYFGKRWNRGSVKVPFILFLRVQFYVESGLLILSSKVQQLYFTELRQKVLRSQSCHQEALFFQLAASALQAEAGDLEQSEQGPEGQGGRTRDRGHRHYFLPEDYFPSWLIKRRGRAFLLQHGPVLHGELRGVSRRHAILRFIKEVGRLQDGAVTFYRMRQEVDGKQCALFDFSWADVDRFTFQGDRFEIAPVGSVFPTKLVYYTPSAFHSKHILRHLSDSHRLHISTRDAVSHVQQLENTQATHSYKEAYICDTAGLRQKLCQHDLSSSMSDCSVVLETKEDREENGGTPSEAEPWEEETEEVFVDDPAEVSWLAELLYGVSVDGPLVLPSSHWTAVTMEMKQVLWRRAGEAESMGQQP
ncbi:unnamed protein product [Menidia menidia]|uniref:(Atlantic silverside) hypothetical protein n=1 Tax=Menidia menidia TaxID=238744 RepID=A0A8S4AVE6_9TELE|nr:unnamed protein product [Menidia menidia]